MQETPYIEVKLWEMMGKRNIRTIEHLHKKSGLSRKAISKALNKTQYRMQVDTVAKLCKALDCEIGDLLVLKK
ncbi:helix-turn-helix domain-containing protein [Heyndrickxia camelliae]|uniref:Cro/Cl family transcriptional regulator n=1 Tax=Heyndrickxia camelliae TaxID=1707093 RepID=A0A2N3LNJ2_9BACI|nr:helix-turn-helix transcriptional regulator [Heyndrickxia camelliae]PKR86127.1 Cro/Cl family transcriptional regulator [Heyndrickxia camelliae]